MSFHPASLHILPAFFQWKLFQTPCKMKSYSHVSTTMNSESSPCEVMSVTLTAEPGWVTKTRGEARACVHWVLPGVGRLLRVRLFLAITRGWKYTHTPPCFSWGNGGTSGERTWPGETREGSSEAGLLTGVWRAHLLTHEPLKITPDQPGVHTF